MKNSSMLQDFLGMITNFVNMEFSKEESYNVSMAVSVVHCSRQTNRKVPTSSDYQEPLYSWDFALLQFLEPFTSTLSVPVEETPSTDQQIVCNDTLTKTLEFSVNPAQAFDWILAIILLLILLPVFYCLLQIILLFLRSKFRRQSNTTQSGGKKTSRVSPMRNESQSSEVVKTETETNSEENSREKPARNYPVLKLPPSLSNASPTDRKICQLDTGNVDKYLLQTLDLLNTGLNRVLWKTTSSGGAATVSSPVPGRRWSSALNPRNGRSLNVTRNARSTTSLASIDTEDELTLNCWDEFEASSQRFGWRQTRVPKLNRSKVGCEDLQLVLDYIGTNLSSDGGHWRAASMIASYMLTLLEKELLRVPNAASVGLKFVEFIPIGSAHKGLKAGKPDEFDVLMCLQPAGFALKEAKVCTDNDGSTGKTVLILAESASLSSKRLVKDASLQGVSSKCMVTKQTVFAGHGLLDSALAEISSRFRKLQDKLPLKISKVESRPSFSRVMLDTKPIHSIGFDVHELTLNIIPCICIADGGLMDMPLYAVPKWNLGSVPSSSSMTVPKRRDSSTDTDIFWSLCTTSLEEAFLSTVEKRMKFSAIDSCHKVCLQVLKTMFHGGNCFNSQGTQVIPGYWLETIINYLLLESACKMWTYDCLTRRLSDALNFLKQALQNQRLPDFFIANPHLLKQFPYLSMFPWLSGDKQVNLMSSLSEQSAESLSRLVEERISAAPFSHCIRPDFSPDMWEYEFFVFN